MQSLLGMSGLFASYPLKNFFGCDMLMLASSCMQHFTCFDVPSIQRGLQPARVARAEEELEVKLFSVVEHICLRRFASPMCYLMTSMCPGLQLENHLPTQITSTSLANLYSISPSSCSTGVGLASSG